MSRQLLRIFLCAVGTLTTAWAQAVDIRFEPVAPNVYAFVGETGQRSFENEGLNANIGLVVTPEGALLIDSGASFQGAKQIAQAVKKITPQPIKWVINTGGQDHRWLGNGYFIQQGAQVFAHAGAKADMLARGPSHLAGLKDTLKEKLDGTEPTLPTTFLAGNDETLTLGGMAIEIKHRGGGHTPGDSVVWLPAQQVLFSGDVVYVDRMLGIFPFSNTRRWVESFELVESLKPTHIVPGHGRVSDLARAQADTGNYLRALRAHMAKAVADMDGLSPAIQSFDASPYVRLLNAADLHPGNASRTYLELERE